MSIPQFVGAADAIRALRAGNTREVLAWAGTAPTDDLVDFKNRLDVEISNIREQIRMAKVTTATTGEYADPTWWCRVNKAKAFYGQMSQRVLGLLSRRRRERADAHNRRDAVSFRQAARRILPPELYDAIIREVASIAADEESAGPETTTGA
jgi:hypothetical protein